MRFTIIAESEESVEFSFAHPEEDWRIHCLCQSLKTCLTDGGVSHIVLSSSSY